MYHGTTSAFPTRRAKNLTNQIGMPVGWRPDRNNSATTAGVPGTTPFHIERAHTHTHTYFETPFLTVTNDLIHIPQISLPDSVLRIPSIRTEGAESVFLLSLHRLVYSQAMSAHDLFMVASGVCAVCCIVPSLNVALLLKSAEAGD